MFSLLWQIKYAGSDTDFSASPAFCKQIRRAEPEEQKQKVLGTQMPLNELLEGLIADKELPAKDKKKRLKQVQRLNMNAVCPSLHAHTPYPSSVPEVLPWRLPQAIPHRGEQSCCHSRESTTIQASSLAIQLQEAPPALPEELELQGITPPQPPERSEAPTAALLLVAACSTVKRKPSHCNHPVLTLSVINTGCWTRSLKP